MVGRVAYSILFYVLVMALVFVSKPKFAFDHNAEPKPFGLDEMQTIYPLGAVSIVLAIACFYTFALLDLVFGG
jgi:hypothetical protein